MGTNFLCKGCGKSTQKCSGASGRYCSVECKILNPRKKRSCKPECLYETFFFRKVTFKDGTNHIQRCCRICKKTSYVTKNSIDIENTREVIKNRSEFLKKKYKDSFYTSPEWISLRYKALTMYGNRCQCCKTTTACLHVDHIKPISKYPELKLDINNLQILCEDCNLGKSNKDETDWKIR